MTTNKKGKILYITSLDNSLVKQIRSLTKKKYREVHNKFIAEGEFFLNEAINSKWKICYVLFDNTKEDSFNDNKDLQFLKSKGTNIIFVTKDILIKVTERDNPQDFLFVVEKKQFKIPNNLLNHHISIILENIRDPGNLGSIFRTIEALGVKNCFLIGNCVDPYSREVIRSSMGSLFNLEFLKLTEKEIIKWSLKNNINLIGTSLNTNKSFLNYKWEFPLSLIFGNEKNGISGFFENKCKDNIKIFSKGRAKSLNVSVACGIITQEVIRKIPNNY